MKHLIDFVNESVSKTVLMKTVNQVKKENPDLKPEELRNKVVDILGTEAIASKPEISTLLDDLTLNK